MRNEAWQPSTETGAIAVVQQAPREGPDHLGTFLASQGRTVDVYFAPSRTFPHPKQGYTGLVLLGGPMSVHSDPRNPWLGAQRRAIENFLEAGLPILGICLGAQLLTQVLGADVKPLARPERGFQRIELTGPATDSGLLGSGGRWLRVFQWHDDGFALPRGATLLARSEACPNQAFLYGGNALGVQFHPEVDYETARHFARLDPLGKTGMDSMQGLTEFLREAPSLRTPQPVLAHILGIFQGGPGGGSRRSTPFAARPEEV